MATVVFKGETITDPALIASLMAKNGLLYERWGLLSPSELGKETLSACSDEDILALYEPYVSQLKSNHGYVTADLVALNPDTPNLPQICDKFVKIHYHDEDEVRFTVAGQGVFEIKAQDSQDLIKYIADPGDLIMIPKNRWHLFYLTESKHIRCIRLFKTKAGWEARYA